MKDVVHSTLIYYTEFIIPLTRERTRVLLDSSAKLERYLKLISRKRQRNDLPSNEKSGSGNLLRTVSQVHQNPPDLVVQRHDDRAKSIVSNKRVRSSMGEMRVCTFPILIINCLIYVFHTLFSMF